MNKILDKRELGPRLNQYVLEAPAIARKAKAGQFIILRVNETGERIPLTIANSDAANGTITLVVQEVGRTTGLLARLDPGDSVSDLIGPLGTETHIEKVGTVVCIGGGVGIACIYPIARALKNAGNKVISILGARSSELLIWKELMQGVSDEVVVITDDGSSGNKGLVTDELKRLIDKKISIDLVYTVGPAIMMKAVSEVTRESGIKTIVSLNSVMVDGTGMCGGCRVQVGDETKFVCVHGPDFDGHQVDFDELMKRQRTYLDYEKTSICQIAKQG